MSRQAQPNGVGRAVACALCLLGAPAVLSVGAGCDGPAGPPPIDTDAGCGEPGVPTDQPVLGCPGEIDLGCLTGGARGTLSYTTSATTCDGSAVTVACDPPSGASVGAGEATSVTCVATSATGAMASCSFPIRYRLDRPTLSCTAPVVAACTGPRTAVSVATATWLASCAGGPVPPAPTNDAPVGGYAVGTTTVTSSGEGGASCTTTVEVTDTAPPVIECPSAGVRVVRVSEDDPIASVAVRPATDACDDMPALGLEGTPPAGRGTFTLTATATDDAGNTARCTFTAEVLDLFAPRDLRVISAELMADGSTDATLAWLPSAGADVLAVSLERASAPGGPFTELARLPVATLTYTDASMPSPRAYYRVVALGPDDERGGETPVVAAHAIARAGYDLPAQTVPGVPFRTTLYGVVRHPLDPGAGPYPLVMFLHGNHGNCRPPAGDDDCVTLTEHECTTVGSTTTPNAEGYVYLEESLAAQGFVTVSISANALNCRDDFIPERTALLLEHLRRWSAGTLPLDAALMAATDTTRTSLVGHSRGGEAVSQVPLALRATPIAGVALGSVLAIGPTDYHDNTPSGVPYLALLPGCDADVFDLQGARMVDRGAAAEDGEIKAHVLFVGTNHNYFNTEWRYDDDVDGMICASSTRVSAATQRGGLEALLGTWLAITVRGDTVPGWLRNETGSPDWMDAWAGDDLDLRESYFSPDRVVIDDFAGSLTTDTLGLPVSMTGYTAATACTGTCAASFAHVTPGARLAWNTAAALASFSSGDLDATGRAAISIRLASRAATINNGIVAHDLTLRVRDASGASTDVLLSSLGSSGGLRHLYPARDPLEVLETFRLPFASIAPAIDVSSIAAIELEMPVAGSPQGSIWVTSLELAGD